jgi:glyoxylase-like metal-dependent hydrolase (beta-lactamase superfamily II)
MCTHLHIDHVGWNTQLRDGRWVPTFPNARYIFAEREWESWQVLHHQTSQAQIVDSVLPVIEARQAQFVSDGFALDDEVRLEPTPGHTAGHVSIHLSSRGTHAVITGDCIHSPVQCLEPEWIMRSDSDPALARTTRRDFLERYCDSSALVCASHFPEPSIGRVVRRDGTFRFSYEAGP